MKRMQSRKSHSWWWDSHVSPKNSRWLSENLEQMDRLIKEMLKLIEEEGDSFAKKAEMYYQRRPKLLAHVEDFYRMYRALAERYDNVTGELRKNMPSDLRSQSSGNGSDFGPDPPSPSLSPSSDQTPERGKNRPKAFNRAAGFGVFLGSAASSDFSRKGSDDSPSSSSSSSQSGSDSEDGKVVDVDDNTSGLTARIAQLEEELREANEKIKEHENGFNGRCDHDIDLSERKEVLEIRILEQEKLIEELKSMAEESSARFLHENSLLESKVCSLTESEKNYETKIRALENRVVEVMAELDLLRSEKDELVDSKNIHEAEIRAFRDRVMELEAAKTGEDRGKLIDELNQTLDRYKVKVDMLTSEKDVLNARVSELVGSEIFLEAKIQAFETRVMELEAAKTEACEDNAKLRDELNARVSELVNSKISLEAKIQAFEIRVMELEAAKTEACGENARLRAELDVLTSEKDEFNARVRELVNSKISLEATIQAFEIRVMELEAAKTEACCENAKLRDELVDSKNTHDSKISELESAKTEANQRAKIIDELNRSLDAYKLKVDNLSSERDELNARVSELVDSKNLHESKITELESAETKANERAKIIEELNRSLGVYKLKIDFLASEKDELNARVVKLTDDAKCSDENCRNAADHLHQLHIEHVNLMKEFEGARKELAELKSRVRNLEGEVESQRVLILDGAERKREAIRQLCFSLEHYRDRYQMLRRVFQGHGRRFPVIAV